MHGHESCGNCRYWKRQELMKPGGFCRQKPPTVFLVGMGKTVVGDPYPLAGSYWPQVPDTEWCGAWVEAAPAPKLKIDLDKLNVDELAGSS